MSNVIEVANALGKALGCEAWRVECAADTPSWCDEVPDEVWEQHRSKSIAEPWDYTVEDQQRWDNIIGGGLYNVAGYPAVSYLTAERIPEFCNFGGDVLICGKPEYRKDFVRKCYQDESLDVEHLLWFPDEPNFDTIREHITNHPIKAVVLLYQQETLQHVRTLLEVPAKRGLKRIPIFHITDEWGWKGERLVAKKEFVKVIATEQPAVISTSRDFASKEFEAPEVMLEVKESESPVLHHPSMGEIHAYRGVGKTNLTLGLLNALATGGEFLCYKATRPYRTVDFDGEMDGGDLQESLKLLAEENDNFHMVARCEQPENFMPSMATEEGLAWYEEAIDRCDAEIAVFDNWSTLANIGTNEEEAFFMFTAWARKMRLRGVTVIYLHHDGKDQRTQRGHSKPEDPLNWVIGLRWQGEYKGQEGLKCVLEFEKCRKPVYECAKIALELRDGAWCWGKTLDAVKPTTGRPILRPTDEQLEQLKSLLSKGEGERAIAKEMQVSRDLVRRWKNELLGKKSRQEEMFDADKEQPDD